MTTIQLRDYQREAITATRQAWARGVRRPAVVLPTGAGKTVTFAALVAEMRQAGVRSVIMAHRDELIGQAVAKVRAYAPWLRVGVYQGPRRELRGRDVAVASVQTLARAPRRAELAAAGFRLVIVDECFPAGTLVGSRPIEALRVGDLVPSYDERTGEIVQRPVTATMQRRPEAMVRVVFVNGETLTCTPNHPLMTDTGWQSAGRLRHGASVLHSMHANRDHLRGVSAAGDADREAQDRHMATVGAHLLRRRLPGYVGEAGRGVAFGGDQSQVRLGAHEAQQPDGTRRIAAQDARDDQADRAQASDTRRQRRRHPSTVPTGASARSANGGCGTDPQASGQRLPDVLQGGHRGRGGEGRHRDRRWVAWFPSPQGRGRQARRALDFARVDRIEVLERGSDGTFAGVCHDGWTYNIEVAGTHTYLANGYVAHNCHHGTATSYVETLRALGAFSDDPDVGAYALGVTATMGRSDRVALGQVWQEVVYRRDIVQMIREGHLVNAKGVRVRVEGLDFGKIKRAHGDYADAALSQAMSESLAPAAVARTYVEHAKDRLGVLFTPTVALAYEMAEALRAEGIPAVGLDGTTPTADRRRILAEHSRGDVQVVCNAAVLTEGWDAPWCSCVVIARPTSSAGLYVQMAGRGLRPHPGKRDALIIDVVGVTGRHRLASLVDLSGADRVEKLDDELARYEPDAEVDLLGLLDPEPSGRAGRGFDEPGMDGPLTSEVVNLFGSSHSVWLRTLRGVWFLPAGDRLVFLAPSGDVGRYLVGRIREDGRGEWLVSDGVDLELAMTWGETYASADGADRLNRKGAGWRKAAPGERQVARAGRLGIPTDGRTRGELSDEISRVLASGRLDMMPCIQQVTMRGYW